MAKRPYQLTGLRSTIALVVSVIFVVGAADTALAQTSPDLKFLNDSLAKRAKHGDQETRAECPSQFDKDVETATAPVFVLLSGDQEATSIRFLTEVPVAGGEVPAAGSGGLAASSYNQLVTENRLIVQAEPAKNEQPGLSIKPSEVKVFNLTFLICSSSKAPGLGHYLLQNEIPVEWASFAGQLVVRDSANSQIGPGTVSLQLTRPALGYERTYFKWIMVVAVLFAAVFLVLMYVLLMGKRDENEGDIRGKSDQNLTFDFKTGLVIPSTASAAIIGTLLTTTILPSDTFFMPKGQYATLNAVFGLVAVLVGIVYNNSTKGWIFVIGAGVALGAGVGEAITVWFLLKEMGFQGSLPAAGVYIVQITLLVALGLITFLALKKVVSEVNKPGRSAAEYPPM